MGSSVQICQSPAPFPIKGGGTDSASEGAAMTRLIGRRLYSGASAPSPKESGDLWQETGTNILWYWNGTYWLSTKIYYCAGKALGATGTVNGIYFSPEINSTLNDMYVLSATATIFVSTTNNSGDFWNVTWRWFNGANSYTNLGATPTLSSIDNAPNIWVTESRDINTWLDVSVSDVQGFDWYTAKTNSPGAIYLGTTLSYRLAHL